MWPWRRTILGSTLIFHVTTTEPTRDFHDEIRPKDQRIPPVVTGEKLTATIALALPRHNITGVGKRRGLSSRTFLQVSGGVAAWPLRSLSFRIKRFFHARSPLASGAHAFAALPGDTASLLHVLHATTRGQRALPNAGGKIVVLVFPQQGENLNVLGPSSENLNGLTVVD